MLHMSGDWRQGSMNEELVLMFNERHGDRQLTLLRANSHSEDAEGV